MDPSWEVNLDAHPAMSVPHSDPRRQGLTGTKRSRWSRGNFCRRSLETLGWIIKFVTLINYNMCIYIYIYV